MTLPFGGTDDPERVVDVLLDQVAELDLLDEGAVREFVDRYRSWGGRKGAACAGLAIAAKAAEMIDARTMTMAHANRLLCMWAPLH